MPSEEILGVGLGRFQSGRQLARAEAAQAVRGECVGDAEHQRSLRPDDGQIDAFALRKRQQPSHVVRLHGNVLHPLLALRTGIAGSDEHLRDARRLRGLPGQGMFATATTDHENFHLLSAGSAAFP